MITLYVGEEKKSFTVHRTHLLKASAFFRLALKKDWKEGQERKIDLPDDDPTMFANYLHFCYTGKLATNSHANEVITDCRVFEDEITLLSALYVLGEKLQDSHFKNAVLDAFIEIAAIEDTETFILYPTGAAVNRIYRGTGKRSLARKLLVDMDVACGISEWIYDSMDIDFVKDVARSLLQKVTSHTSTGSFRKNIFRNQDYHEQDHPPPVQIDDQGALKRKREEEDEPEASRDVPISEIGSVEGAESMVPLLEEGTTEASEGVVEPET